MSEIATWNLRGTTNVIGVGIFLKRVLPKVFPGRPSFSGPRRRLSMGVMRWVYKVNVHDKRDERRDKATKKQNGPARERTGWEKKKDPITGVCCGGLLKRLLIIGKGDCGKEVCSEIFRD